MVKELPKVSLCMPVYNGGRYFPLALESALAQDYPNLEIVVVNDGSTDNGETERAALLHSDRIRYVRQPNGGVASALNHALRLATGHYFAWLSHDDIHFPHKTSAQVKFLEELGRPDACLFSDYQLIGPDDEIVDTIKLPAERIRRAPRWPLFRGMINGCSLLVPMRYMREYGPFDECLRYVQDYDLWERILTDHEFFHQPEVLIQYRIHPGQDTHKPQVANELNPAWIRIMDRLSPSARAQVWGSSARFYEEMADFIGHSAADQAAAYARVCSRSAMQASVSIVLAPTGTVAGAEASIRSVLSQDYLAFEILLAGGEGDSAFRALASMDDRILIVPCADASLALYEALLRVRGEYIVLLEAGDTFSGPRLRRQVGMMASHGALVSYTDHYVGQANGLLDKVSPGSLLDQDLAPSAVMMHRAVIDVGLVPGLAGGIPWGEIVLRYEVLHVDEPLLLLRTETEPMDPAPMENH